MEKSALCSCHLGQPLERSSWNCTSTHGTEAFPIQSQLCNCIPTSIFTDQSEQLHSDQSGQCFLDQSNCKDLESSLDKDGPIRDQGQVLLFIQVSSPLAEQTCTKWSKAEQNCPSAEGPRPRTSSQPPCFTAVLLHN